MMMVVMEPKPQSRPVRITPPWVIIGIGIGLVIVCRPKIDLFARNKGISIIHFAERLDLLAYDFSCNSDLFPSPKDVGI